MAGPLRSSSGQFRTGPIKLGSKEPSFSEGFRCERDAEGDEERTGAYCSCM